MSNTRKLDKLQNICEALAMRLADEKVYIGLFKAAILLFSVALLALKEVGPFLYERDLAAHKDRFELEAKVARPLKEIDCAKPGPLRSDCLYVKHQFLALGSSLELLDLVIRSSVGLAVTLFMLAVVGFLFRKPEAARA